MKLTEICIQRPVLSCVISLILMVIGMMAYDNLSQRYFPRFESSIIRVMTTYNGASASLMETNVTTPLEKAISGIPGIDTVQSESSQGTSVITIRLKTHINPFDIASQIRDKVAQARSQLPDLAEVPEVRSGWDNEELMDFFVTDSHKTPNAVQDYLERYVIDSIEDIPGVANVELSGANRYAMRVRLNPIKMKQASVSINDVINAIQNSNVELPAGEIQSKSLDFPVNLKTGLTTAAQFNNIAIKTVKQSVIRLKDVARVNLGNDSNLRTVVKANGKPALWLQVYPSIDGNPITTASKILQFINKLHSQIPKTMKIHMFYNEADFMQRSINEVYIAILIAVICVTGVIFLFLGDLRSALIPVVTIPVCLLASFAMIYVLGFSLNLITLLALVLAVGLIVDDAIVMLENIYRHREQGIQPLKAALQGSREMAFPIIAMTLTLAAVYAPIGLIHSHAAIIFRSFAFTLASSVIISGFIALTLTPMMCARFIPSTPHKKKGYALWLEHFFSQIECFYHKRLQACLKHRLIWVIVALLIALAGGYLLHHLPKQFMPTDDQGLAIAIISPPESANNPLIDDMVKKTTDIIKKTPGVANTLSVSTNHRGGFNAVFFSLKPFHLRKQHASEMTTQLNAQFKAVPGLDVHAFPIGFGGSNRAQLEFFIMSSGSYIQLYQITEKVKNALLKYSGITTLDSDINFDTPEYDIQINRALAAHLQVSVKNIDTTIAALLGGQKASTFHIGGKTYNVYVQAKQQDLDNITHINQFYVTSLSGASIPLGNLVRFQRVVSQETLSHYNRLRAAKMSGQISSAYTLGQIVSYLQKTLPQLLPDNASFAFKGKAKKLLETSSNMSLLFGLAFVFIYLVLAAQFESFFDPIVILIVVPLSIVSAVAALKAIGGSLNIYTDIGLVTLIGLIAKHGILITQFANQLQRQQGLSAHEALIQAAKLRLRPILMTSAAMIFGALPLALATGANAHSREQIGGVIIAGLFFGTFFSLILVPVAYSYLSSARHWLRQP